ncbi:Protein argonaute 1 [Zea mays]|uniref:Protein argonaute 1 n=1 Tax=Zea mays TaxID=4577 RepID=A0A1D6IHT5_MAIZE|nr:Protein argonaute 1 [Zea mays]
MWRLHGFFDVLIYFTHISTTLYDPIVGVHMLHRCPRHTAVHTVLCLTMPPPSPPFPTILALPQIATPSIVAIHCNPRSPNHSTFHRRQRGAPTLTTACGPDIAPNRSPITEDGGPSHLPVIPAPNRR